MRLESWRWQECRMDLLHIKPCSSDCKQPTTLVTVATVPCCLVFVCWWHLLFNTAIEYRFLMSGSLSPAVLIWWLKILNSQSLKLRCPCNWTQSHLYLVPGRPNVIGSCTVWTRIACLSLVFGPALCAVVSGRRLCLSKFVFSITTEIDFTPRADTTRQNTTADARSVMCWQDLPCTTNSCNLGVLVQECARCCSTLSKVLLCETATTTHDCRDQWSVISDQWSVTRRYWPGATFLEQLLSMFTNTSPLHQLQGRCCPHNSNHQT